jgi:hypothetical protein
MANTTPAVFYPLRADGQPDFSPKLAPVVAHRFPHTPHKAGLLSRDVTPDSAAKAYVAVADSTTYLFA